MRLYYLMELCIYFALLPIIYKVIMAVDISKIFKKDFVTEIKIFYIFLVIIMTKIIGDFIIVILDYFRLVLL